MSVEYVAGTLPAELHGAFTLALGVYVLPYASTKKEPQAITFLLRQDCDRTWTAH